MCDFDKKWYVLDIFWDFIDNDIDDILLSVLLCWYFKDYHGQLTPEFLIFFIFCVCGQFTAVIEINLFRHVLWAFFFLKVCIIFHLSVKFLHLGCYQVNQISINRIDLCNAEKTQASSEVAFRCIYTQFNAALRDMEYFNLQLQMYK